MSKRIAVVTGASAGIGAALAVRLVKAGYEPLLLARRTEKLREVAARVATAGGTAHVESLDVTAPGAAVRALEAAIALGEPECLVNNAGRGVYGKFAESPLADQLGQLDLNVRVVVEMTRTFLPAMLARKRGYVLNVASTAGLQAGPWQCVYSATKAFVINFTEGLAAELDGSGVSATALLPGPTATEFIEVAGYETKGLKVPKGVLMSADKVADAGVRGMLRHRSIVVAGLHNKAGALAAKLAPRFLATKTTELLFRPRSGG